MWMWIGLGALMLVLLVQTIHLGVVLSSTDLASRGLGYFGLPPAGRDAFRARLRRQAVLLSPILRLVGRFSTFRFDRASFEHEGVNGPRGTCTEDSFAAAAAYEPLKEDVFVVTQMKSGTTWMQHVVYETLMRGAGELVETGTALYAVSPWLEGVKSVSVEDAPLLGSERTARIIKTHLPASVCPLDDRARYIYVVRHPVSCFASCADFIAANAGRLAPSLGPVEDWFCSGEMWWGPWPEHVEGWWRASRASDNVLFVHFEDMKADLTAVVDRVATFLGISDLSEREVAEIVQKSGFDYMREHARTFEMHPPHLLATDAEMFVKGTADRHRDVPEDVRRRISAWCAERLEDASYPLADRYPDVLTPPN